MDQNDWQYSQQHRQRMPDTPPHQNVRRYSHQPMQQQQQQVQQSPKQQQQSNPATTSSQYAYTTPARLTASPSSRHSITSDFSGINIRDDAHVVAATVEKSARPNLSLHPSTLRPNHQQQQGSVPSSPTRQSAPYNSASYAPPQHPGLGRTTSDEMRHYVQQPPSNSRHSSPMHTVSPSMSPYYSTTPHTLNSINEREQTMSWNQVIPTQPRQSPSRPAYAFPPPGRDSVSPRSHLKQSPTQHRHSIPHVPPNYDSKAQFSPRQATHFPSGTAIAVSPNISPTSFSPRHATFAMNRDPGSIMPDIVYSNPPPAKFRIVVNSSELSPTVNTQPKYRRANPDGGFISVCSLL